MSNQWMKAEHFIINTLSQVKDDLQDSNVKSIEHFIDHDEYEMAFEILFLEIMQLAKKPTIDFNETMEMAKFPKLDEDSVYDSDFWEKFQQYCK